MAMKTPVPESTAMDAKPAAISPTVEPAGDYRARTERLRILIDFLARPIAAAGAPDDVDDEVISADNLARVQALQAVRMLAIGA